MYVTQNFKTKKALKEAVAIAPVACYQPGSFGGSVPDGTYCCEGPHYPAPHSWYASVIVKDGQIIKVKG